MKRQFGVKFSINLTDLVLLDWLMFCFITPTFIIIPGIAGMKGYKNYQFHIIAFLKGTILSIVAGLVIAGIIATI